MLEGYEGREFELCAACTIPAFFISCDPTSFVILSLAPSSHRIHTSYPKDVEINEEKIILSDAQTITIDQLAGLIPTELPCFHFFMWKHEHEGESFESLSTFFDPHLISFLRLLVHDHFPHP